MQVSVVSNAIKRKLVWNAIRSDNIYLIFYMKSKIVKLDFGVGNFNKTLSNYFDVIVVIWSYFHVKYLKIITLTTRLINNYFDNSMRVVTLLGIISKYSHYI